MHLKKLAEDFYVSPQITRADVKALAEKGFGGIICNRPDGEDYGQLTFADIAAEARALGLEAVHVPVRFGANPATVEAFHKALERLPKPVLGYCRTGARSQALWQAARASQPQADTPKPEGQTAPAGSGLMGALRRLRGN